MTISRKGWKLAPGAHQGNKERKKESFVNKVAVEPPFDGLLLALRVTYNVFTMKSAHFLSGFCHEIIFRWTEMVRFSMQSSSVSIGICAWGESSTHYSRVWVP